MTFEPLGMDRTLYEALIPFRAAAGWTIAVRKINPRPLRRDDVWRRLQWRGWLQWLGTKPVGPGTHITARMIDVSYKLTKSGLDAMHAYEVEGNEGSGLPDGWFWLLDDSGDFVLGDEYAIAGA